MTETETGIQLSPEEYKIMVELYQRAKTTPVIGFSTKQMLEGKDLASLAWNDVRKYQEEMGRKYGYDPKSHGIGMDGKIIKI